jgi:hypothetical protein
MVLSGTKQMLGILICPPKLESVGCDKDEIDKAVAGLLHYFGIDFPLK